MSEALCVKELVKDYRSLFGRPHRALRGLTLSVPRGAAFGLIGPNGAGKTTFIKVLLGVARATSGEVSVLGGEPGDLAVRARIGYLPERLHLPSALRARDFLRSVATLKGLAVSDAQLAQALDRVGLRADARRIGTFSKGMRQRLGLAAAMLGQPDLLILDEPTDGIDPLGRVEVRTLLQEEKRRGATLLLNSHLLSETERICDRVGVLQAGQLQLEGPLASLTGRSDRWAVRFASAPDPAVLRACGLTAEAGGAAFEGDAEALNAALDSARRAGLQLVELTRATRDLEAVLADLERPS